MTSDIGKYFDDFELGESHTTDSRTITENDYATWVGLTGYPEPRFVDRQLASENVFGRPIVVTQLIQAIAAGLWEKLGLTRQTTMAFLSSQNRAISPLFVGDTIHVVGELSSKKPAASKKDRGVITFLYTVLNQDDQPVLSFSTTMMVKRRFASAPEGK